MLRYLLRPVWVLLAIVFLIEAFLWDHLEPVVARLVAAIPLSALKQWLANRIEALSPAMTLIVFVVPLLLLFPLKVVGLWLLAHRCWTSALSTLLIAKLAGVGVSAFVFDVTREKLLEMEWFERLYEAVLAMRASCHAMVAPVKEKIVNVLRGGGSPARSRTLRRISRLRKSMHEAREEAGN